MKKNFEYILLSILFGTSVLLGLSFWLNIKFGFNLFSAQHWDELSKLQAAHTPISPIFYISIGIAIFLFISGLYMIFKPRFRDIFKQMKEKTQQKQSVVKEAPVLKTISEPEPIKTEQKTEKEPENLQINSFRPRRLDLPKNISEVAAAKHAQSNITPNVQPKDTTEYNETLEEIFKENNYTVKKPPVISGFTPNLFAIGTKETLWIGAIDCDIEKIRNSIKKLSEVFSDTLSDIEIHINAFLIDTMGRYNSDNDIKIFQNIDLLRQFISDNPGEKIKEDEQEDFDAYSEYIDTIIQYIKNI